MTTAYFLRVAAEQTLEQVASATGLSADTISLLERGETRRPHPRTLNALAAHYGVSVRQLLTDTPEAA